MLTVQRFGSVLKYAGILVFLAIPALMEAAGVTVGITPSYATLAPSQTQQFQAFVTGTANAAVTWSVSPQTGTISASGLYTAPATVAALQTVVITATSVALTTAQASTISITLNPPAKSAQAATLATFSLPELFGATWPDQPIEFRYDGGKPPVATTRMIGPKGTEVPYQWVSSCSDATAVKGCIVVRSGLAANSTYTWTLQSGTAPAAAAVNGVQLNQVGQNWELTNGLTGVRMRTVAGNPGPFNVAPVQGIQLPNGTWTGSGTAPNLLYSEGGAGYQGCVGCTIRTPMTTATGYTVTVVDSGPLKTVIRATYTFNRPRYYYGSTVVNTAGAGHYTITLTLYAQSKSVLVDEDSDMQFSYYLPLYNELTPDQARYRGHDSISDAGTNDPACGYETPAPVTGATNASPAVITAAVAIANGQTVLIAGVGGNLSVNGKYFAKTTGYPAGQFGLYSDSGLTKPVAGNGSFGGGGTVKPAYRGQSVQPASDAYLDVTFASDRPANYLCSQSFNRKLLVNYPAANHAAGWYEELYKSGAGAAAPVVGFYTGRASQQIASATGPSMPGLYTSNNHWITGKTAAGIQLDNFLRGPDGSIAPLIHRNWGLFVGTQASLIAPASHQPIADEQNSLTGINLSRLYTYQLVYPDPPGGWTWQYMSAAGANQLINQVRNGTSLCGTVTCEYNLLYSSETSQWGRALLDMWKGNSSAAVQTALNGALLTAQKIVTVLSAGDNHYDGPLGYYQLGLSTSPQTAVLNAILMDYNTTPAQKTTAKAILALFGSILWDNDWFAIDNPSGDSYGLANQVQQYLQYRTQSAAAAPSQPFLAATVLTAANYPCADLNTYFSATGAPMGSTHYQSAFFEPLILNYLNFAQSGKDSMSDPKWAAYAKWELSIQTPPEPRFGNIRKGYSNGDGNTEADVRTGMLGTALYSVNPTLGSNLMWAWKQSSSPTQLTEDSQFVTSLVAIDPNIPAVAPQLGSINVPGYHTAERHNFGTPNETAVWFINGSFYSDQGHRHADDGQVTIYAHDAPLAIDWNANLYSPQTPGRFMHNSVVFDSEMNHLWSTDNPGLSDANTALKNPTNTQYAGFTNSTTSTGTFTETDGTVWTRSVRTMNFNATYPVIYVKDSFAGPGALTGKTITWNLMATGTVKTPTGSVDPTIRFSTGCQSPAGALPSNGLVSNLPNGINQFKFTGAIWPKHPTQGIDFDVFTLATSSAQQFMIGNWGHGCHPTRESGEYQTANGKPFAETQDILRIHDNGPVSTIIMPYRKTEAPAARTVATQTCGVQIVQGAETTCFNDSAATYSNGTKAVLTVYDSSSQTAFGVTASGGMQEVAVQSGKVTWTIGGGDSGSRNLTLPGKWYANQSVPLVGNTYAYSYSGGLQNAPVTIVFSQTP